MDGSVVSQRGKVKLEHESHMYTFSKMTKSEEHAIWVCEKRSTCKGRVWTRGIRGEVTKIVTQHNHAAQAARPDALRLLNNVKQRAITTHEQPQQIIANAVANIHPDVLALLPRKDSLKRTARNARNHENIPSLPRSINELIIPQEYRDILIDGVLQQFLVYDSEQELLPGRILVFSTRINLQLLSQSHEWLIDGTFSTAPIFFEQLFTIHVVQFSAVIPVIYALLPNKTRATYIKFLQVLKNLQPGLQPQKLMSDFELAVLQAFELEFPLVQKTGCFFHLSQCIWRKVQNEGLKVLYENNHEFSRWIRMIPALAFVPPESVIDAFEELVEQAEFPEAALPIANYFEDTYIGHRQRRGRQTPMFSIHLWNVYQRTLDGQHRTNNYVEGWHRSFQETCGHRYPNIFRFISCLKQQQGVHSYEITQLIRGNPGNSRNKKYAAISARIKTIVTDFANRNVIDYLRGIAYNFEF